MTTTIATATAIAAPVDHVEPALSAAVAAYWANRLPSWLVEARAQEAKSLRIRSLLTAYAAQA